jgi:hypothetical protein
LFEESEVSLLVIPTFEATAEDLLVHALKPVLYPLINLDELAMQPPFPVSVPLARQQAAEARLTPILSGQKDVTINVHVIFLIR